MTQEFHLSVTPIRNHEYLVRTEQVAPGVPLAEETVIWNVEDWLMEASLLMDDPLSGLLRGDAWPATLPNGTAKLNAPGQSKAAANLVAFGQRLYNALFQGTIRDSWMMAQGIAQYQHQRLRFRLGLKGTQLHRLPWEVLYAGDRPLAAGTDIIFSRYHSSFSVLKFPLQKRGVSSVQQPLKILMVLASPGDQEMLALKQEAEHLQQELRGTTASGNSQFSGIDLTILNQPGREQLTHALEHNHYHVLHYAGHSDLSAGGGSLCLVNNQTGLTEVLSGEDLAGLLVNNGVRMAVFNSCRGVYTATSESDYAAEGNLAEALVRRGVPAVLAMAERIPDSVALNLSRLFYRNLRQEAYPIDLSLGRARQGLISSYGSNQLYWALPILYLHPDFDGFLLPTSGTGADEPPLSQNSYYPASEDGQLLEDSAIAADDRHMTEWLLKPDEAVQDGLSLAEKLADGWPLDEDLENPDDLIFEDPDPPEEERVAQLAYEVSHNPTLLEPEEALLSAPPTENLLPDPSPNGRRPVTQPSEPRSPVLSKEDFSELKNVLAEMGTLTPEIAASSQAVQANPNSAEAYTGLGWALYQQGYVNDAISAYNQAIRLDPTYAKAFNHLGLAFYQQGRVDEAIRAYSRAVQLDPTMTEASTNLRNALYGDAPTGSAGIASGAASSGTVAGKAQAPKSWQRVKQRRLMLWGGIGTIAIAVLVGGWIYREAIAALVAAPLERLLPSQSSKSLRGRSADELASLATTQLEQRNLAEAEAAILELFKRNNLSTAAKVLDTVPAPYTENPTINFLRGRVAWQRWLAGEQNASIETARQLWEKAAQAQESAKIQNALGFAYYAQGKVDLAEAAWLKALRFSGQPSGTTAPPNQTFSAEALTAYAGLTLTASKQADNQPANSPKQAELQNAAKRYSRLVLDNDRVNYQPDRLQQNWMWSPRAIQDWQPFTEQNQV